MMIKSVMKGAAFAGAMALATGAMADGFGPRRSIKDFAPSAPFVAPFSWTGFYVGAHVGYVWSDTDVGVGHNNPAFFGPAFAAGSTVSGYSISNDGFMGGVGIGYNFQSGTVVFGVEADISWTDVGGSQSVTTAVPGFVNGFGAVSQSMDYFGTLRGRIGLLVSNQLLAYVTGGLAYGRVEQSYSWSYPGAGELYAGSRSGVDLGWTIGGGLEWALNRNWTFKGEYLYYDLGGDRRIIAADRVNGAPAGAAHLVNFDDNTGHIVRLGINYKF